MHYPDIIEEVGCLMHYNTNRAENKNANGKRKYRIGNNSKNVIGSINRSENMLQASLTHFGAYEHEVKAISQCQTIEESDMTEYEQSFFSEHKHLKVTKKISYKGTVYIAEWVYGCSSPFK